MNHSLVNHVSREACEPCVTRGIDLSTLWRERYIEERLMARAAPGHLMNIQRINLYFMLAVSLG